MNIPLVDLHSQYDPIKEEIVAGIEEVLAGMRLFLGENGQMFEAEFSQFCGAEHGIGVSDGTQALHLILRALGIGAGDEVITVAHTFIATAEAIVLAGARPVFIDVDPQTYLMDVAQVEARVRPQTKAILPVHLYGQTVDMDPLLEIAARYGLHVIEDACQAHGARYKGRRAGSLGEAAAFSFYYSKNLGAYGEGGFITTRSAELARKIRMLRDHGSGSRYQHDLIGCNARLDEIQAAVLRAKLPHLASWNELRRRHARQYNRLLAGLPAATPAARPENEHVYHLYVIRVADRDGLQAFLKEQGIGTGIHYPIPAHLQKALRFLGYKAGDLPVTERAAQEILSIPMYAELQESQIACVAGRIGDYFSGSGWYSGAPRNRSACST